MALDKILAISKKPGLFKLINPSKGGYIVECISKKKRFYVKANSDLSLLGEGLDLKAFWRGRSTSCL